MTRKRRLAARREKKRKEYHWNLTWLKLAAEKGITHYIGFQFIPCQPQPPTEPSLSKPSGIT